MAERPLRVLAAFAVLAALGAVGALTLDARAGTDTLVGRGADSFEATEEYERDFGDDAVVVLVRGELERTLLTPDLGRLIVLEDCLGGKVPREFLGRLPAPCRELREMGAAHAVYGPGTFISTSVDQIAKGLQQRRAQSERSSQQAAAAASAAAARRGASRGEQREAGQAAREAVLERFKQELFALAARYGITQAPSVDNPSFVSQLVFETARGPNVPKERFAYLFPSGGAAVIQVRLRPGLSDDQRARAVDLVRAVVATPAFRLTEGARYGVTGGPVIEEDLGNEVRRAVLVLLLAGFVIMAFTLALVFRSRLRLLPLTLALGAAAIAFGVLAAVGGSLTMASIAALPVLIGLGVDYAIQFHARWNEAREERAGMDRAGGEEGSGGGGLGGEEHPRGDAFGGTRADPGGPGTAALAASRGGPVIATAGLASLLGFLVVVLSPVPMVRGFGLLVVFGVVVALASALTAGFAALSRFDVALRSRPADVPPVLPRARRMAARVSRGVGLAAVAGAAGRGGRTARVRISALAARALEAATTRPRRVLAMGAVLALLGVVADTQTEVVSDVRELVPEDMRALRDVTELTDATGVAGEVDVTVRADDLTRPDVVRWMSEYKRGLLAAHGYRPGASCAASASRETGPELCPGFSITDLLRPTDGGGPPATRATLESVPPEFSQAVLSKDRRTANIAFGIRLMPLDRQQEVIKDMNERLDPPPGVEAAVAGAPVLVAEGNAALASPWRRMLIILVGLAAVFGVLYAARGRRFDAAAVPLIPIALAVGWSSLVLFVLRIPLNPLSASLGALVIAISTEFSVLLSARYEEERRAGFEPPAALRRTLDSTGAAVLASGITAIAGFAALIASDIRMLRDFGIVTVVDLTVSLLGVMIVLPAALMWAEEHGPIRLQDFDPRPWIRRVRSGSGRERVRGSRPSLGRLRLPGRPRSRA